MDELLFKFSILTKSEKDTFNKLIRLKDISKVVAATGSTEKTIRTKVASIFNKMKCPHSIEALIDILPNSIVDKIHSHEDVDLEDFVKAARAAISVKMGNDDLTFIVKKANEFSSAIKRLHDEGVISISYFNQEAIRETVRIANLNQGSTPKKSIVMDKKNQDISILPFGHT